MERFFRDRGIRSGRASESWRAYTSLTDVDKRRAFVRTVRAVIDPGGQSVSAIDRLYLTSEIPTLIVWGTHDHIIPVEHAHVAHDAMPSSHCRRRWTLPHVEEPIQFARLITDFTRDTKPLMTDRTKLAAKLRAGTATD